MKRRAFLKQAAAGVAAGAVASPAIAQGTAPVRWRLAASWPKALDTVFGTVDEMCKRIAVVTDNKFQISAFAGGEVVPPLQVLDAVRTARSNAATP